MTDTMLLDEIALEAAAKGVMDNDGCTRDGVCAKCKEAAQAALTAYFASLMERGMMQIALIEGDKVQGFWSELGVERKITIIKRGDWP